VKKRSPQSAFFTPRVLIGLAFCSIGLLLALLAFALYPGGNALAQRPQQDQASVAERLTLEQQDVMLPETEDASRTLGTQEIILSQGLGDPIVEPNNIFGVTTPFVAACVATVLPNNGGLSANERAPNTNFRFGRSVYLITAAELAAIPYPSGVSPTTIGFVPFNRLPGEHDRYDKWQERDLDHGDLGHDYRAQRNDGVAQWRRPIRHYFHGRLAFHLYRWRSLRRV